jgi:hypothetical protein
MRRAASTLSAIAALLAAAVLAITGSDAAANEVITRAIQPDRMIIELRSEPFDIVAGAGGHSIRMQGFGRLTSPGEPALPLERFLVALPPGARALSADVLSVETSSLPGIYRVEPSPPIMFLPDMLGHDAAMKRTQEEWRTVRDAVFLSDAPFPAAAAWLAGSGTLRGYSYAAVAFCPFTYSPESGRLDHHSRIEVSISFTMPPPEAGEAQRSGLLALEPSAREKASRLFSNFGSVEPLYNAAGSHATPPEATYDYVIITAQSLDAAIAASDFRSWKASLGHNVRTVWTTDGEIASQPGVDLAGRIRNFLRSHYATWGIQYVLFVGDHATVPMRVCFPDPNFHVYDPGNPNLVAPGTPTDYYYADLSYPDATSWDLDGDGYLGEYPQDSPDFLAEVSVGRIPVNDPVRITYTLDKLVTFEQDTGAWKGNVLHGAAILFFESQDHSDYPFVDGATCLDSIETGLMGGRVITHYSERAGLVTSPFPWLPVTESAFTSAWRNGQHGIVNWSGHGWNDGAYRTVWAFDDGDGIPESSNGEMQSYRLTGLGTSNLDDDHPSVVFAISCNVGYPEPNPYGNFGIDLLTEPGWGASAGIVSSARPAAVSRDWKNNPGGTEQICYDFNRYVIAEGERLGDALYDGKFDATTQYGWDRVYEFMNLYNFNLYGDPAMQPAGAVVGVADRAVAGSAPELLLGAGHPNPFASSVSLPFTLPAAGPVRITVHDVAGRVVATLVDRTYAPGARTVLWDGMDVRGKRVASGLYFIVAKAGRHEAIRKVILLQ